MNAILLASAGVIILLVGGGVGFWIGRSGVGGSKARVEKAETELEEYKRNVTEHFGQTAAHFQAIGNQYRELYEHMSSGAQALCEPDEAGNRLLFAPGADLAAANAEEPPVETVEEAELRAPRDFAESTVEAEPPAGQVAERADEDASVETETDVAKEPDSETATESQPEAQEKAGERTLH